MKGLREIMNRNKGLFAFGLVVFFLFAGMSKSVAATKTTESVTKKEQSAGTNVLIAENDGDFSDLFKALDCDSDDFEFVLFDEFTNTAFFIAPKVQNASQCICACKDIYTVPLYDLFCNWKLHIS
jgi:hypothetical protein